MNPGQSTSDMSQQSVEPTSEHGTDDPLVLLAVQLNPQPFTTHQSLYASLEGRRRSLEKDQTREQFLAFTSVPPNRASRLSDDASRTSKFCRFTYNTASHLLLAKITSLPVHQLARGSFDRLMYLKLDAVGINHELSPLGSSTFTIGPWTKEADSSWAPPPAGLATRPSFVVEIGLSGPESHLAHVARGWLESTQSPVRLVVTVRVQQERPEVCKQRWQLVAGHLCARRQCSAPQAHCTQSVRIYRLNNATSVAEGQSELDLPFASIVGRPPQPPLERDLAFTRQELIRFAEGIWTQQRFIAQYG